MDRFYLVAIMLFAISYDMVDNTIVRVLEVIDHERGTTPLVDYLEFVYSEAKRDHDLHNISFGVYDKYFSNQQFIERVSPF